MNGIKIVLNKRHNEYLDIYWDKGFTYSKVFFDGKLIGEFFSRGELLAGKHFDLMTDEKIFIQFLIHKSGFLIKRNGVFIDSSPIHPKNSLKYLIWLSGLAVTIYSIGIIGNLDFPEYWFNRWFEATVFISFIIYTLVLIPFSFLISKGIPYVWSAMLVMIAGFCFAVLYLAFIGAHGPNWIEAYFPYFLIMFPSLILLICLLVQRKNYVLLYNDWQKKRQYKRIVY